MEFTDILDWWSYYFAPIINGVLLLCILCVSSKILKVLNQINGKKGNEEGSKKE